MYLYDTKMPCNKTIVLPPNHFFVCTTPPKIWQARCCNFAGKLLAAPLSIFQSVFLYQVWNAIYWDKRISERTSKFDPYRCIINLIKGDYARTRSVMLSSLQHKLGGQDQFFFFSISLFMRFTSNKSK